MLKIKVTNKDIAIIKSLDLQKQMYVEMEYVKTFIK
jgi:hypothetical protein